MYVYGNETLAAICKKCHEVMECLGVWPAGGTAVTFVHYRCKKCEARIRVQL